jgi:hypothetical protein
MALRFFADNTRNLPLDELESMVLSDPKVKTVKLASRDNAFAGFGFIYFHDKNDSLLLANKSLTVGDFVMHFR